MDESLARLEVSQGYDDARIKSFVAQVMDDAPALLAPLLAAADEGLAVVKPNWIYHSHEYEPDVWESVITHPSVVLAVVEALAERMEGRGTIAICDAPTSQAEFAAILARGGFDERLKALTARFPSLRIETLDLRREIWIQKEQVTVERRKNIEDPRGYTALNLARGSHFSGHRGEGRYYGADYDRGIVNSHHQGDTHEYLLAGTAMKAHLFINVPKLKTHRKTGITCSLKNLVGINGDKNWLPHHTEGYPSDGGDEYPDARLISRFERRLKKFGQEMTLAFPRVATFTYRKVRKAGKQVLGDNRSVVRNGNWHGNDTCWRMVVDLNRALLYGNPDGTWRQGQPKPYFTFVDAIVAGENCGPTAPDAVNAGVLVGGTNPATVDAVMCKLMGFAPSLLKVVAGAFGPHRWPIANFPLCAVRLFDQRVGHEISLDEIAPAVAGGFVPHFAWRSLLRP